MKYLLLLFSIIIYTTVFSQKVIRNNNGWCGTPNTANNTSYDPPPSSQINENLIDPDGVIIIPVVFHVVYNTTAQNIPESRIISQLQRLNTDFRNLNSDVSNVPSVWALLPTDIKVEFRLACIDPNGNPTSGITRNSTSVLEFFDPWKVKRNTEGGYDAWPTNKYLNIWVCNFAPPPFGGLLGHATTPDQYNANPSSGPLHGSLLDGITLDYEVVGDNNGYPNREKGRIGVHEAGHWLGLLHPFTNVGCDDVVWGDNISDTPTQLDPTLGVCPTFPTTDFCSSVFPGIMFMNHMDYTSDACKYMFTTMQSARMRSFIATPGQYSRYPFLKNYFGLIPNNLSNSVCNQHTATISNPMCLSFTTSISGNGTIISTTQGSITVLTPIGVSGSFTLTITSGNYVSQETYNYTPTSPTAPVITAIGLSEMCPSPNTQACVPMWTGEETMIYQAPPNYSQYQWQAIEGTIISGQGTNTITVQHSPSWPPPSYHGASVVVNGECYSEISYIGCIGCDPENPGGRKSLDLKIFPNPVSSDFKLQLNNGKSITRVIIKDIYGNTVLVKEYSINVKEINYNLSAIKPGVYYVQVFDGGKWIAGKFVKE